MRIRQNGFTLLEVLIAMVILSVGLLGLASLQARSLSTNQSAYLRSQANVLAYSIIDRIRANRPTGVLAGPQDITRLQRYNVGFDEKKPSGSSAPTDCVGGSISCDFASRADFDIKTWKFSLGNARTGLPGGDGKIDIDDDGNLVVSIRWLDERSVEDDSSTTDVDERNVLFELRTQL